MAFMEPNYSDETFVEVTNKQGESFLVPQGSTRILSAGETITAIHKGKWFAQLSAPGYMDQTCWSGPFDTEDEAREYIRDTYEIDPDTGDPEDVDPPGAFEAYRQYTGE